MKNSALILLLVAIVAIAAVVYFIFMKSPKYTSWGSFSQPYRIRASGYGPCSNPNSPLNYGNLGDPCCTGTKTCSYK